MAQLMPVEELSMFHGTLGSIEPALYPVVFSEERGGPAWSSMIEHAAVIEDVWKQVWMHGLKGLPFLRGRNHPQSLASCLQGNLLLCLSLFCKGRDKKGFYRHF